MPFIAVVTISPIRLLAPITLPDWTALSGRNVDEALGAVLYGGASHQVGALNVNADASAG